MRRRAALQRIPSIDEYVEHLEKHGDEIESLARDLLINVTRFFRDQDAWLELQKLAIEPIVARKHNDETIRIWVSGCATGEEAYTIALLLLEELRHTKKTCALQIFATDVAGHALEHGAAGRYPQSIEADVPPELLRRYFVRSDSDEHYRVGKTLRDSIVFSSQDLLSDPPFSRLDVICCRNVLIYLKPEVQQKVVALFHFALAENGCLFLGSAETIGPHDDSFEILSKRWRIFRRIGPTQHDRIDFPVAGSPLRRDLPLPMPSGGRGRCAVRRALVARLARAVRGADQPEVADSPYLGRGRRVSRAQCGRAVRRPARESAQGAQPEGPRRRAARDRGAAHGVGVRSCAARRQVCAGHDRRSAVAAQRRGCRSFAHLVRRLGSACRRRSGERRNLQEASRERCRGPGRRCDPAARGRARDDAHGAALEHRAARIVERGISRFERGGDVDQRGAPLDERGARDQQGRAAIAERRAAYRQRSARNQGRGARDQELRPRESAGSDRHRDHLRRHGFARPLVHACDDERDSLAPARQGPADLRFHARFHDGRPRRRRHSKCCASSPRSRARSSATTGAF